MMTKLRFQVLRVGLFFGFFLMLCIDLLRIGGCLLGRFIGGPKTPQFVSQELLLFVVAGITLAAFFKWPLGVVIIGWIDMTLILTHVFPWGGSGLNGFVSQFMTDVAFFIAAHVSLLCLQGLRRSSSDGKVRF